mmetsp:Transcript_19396/g.61709  ORF Transcript_19396/g.61709 Transcript_19396/m.61709 type:complete len:85 (-) Transcript_19396:888-1142(-)
MPNGHQDQEAQHVHSHVPWQQPQRGAGEQAPPTFLAARIDQSAEEVAQATDMNQIETMWECKQRSGTCAHWRAADARTPSVAEP